MPQVIIRNRRPASNQPDFTPIADFLLPLADTTTGNVTLPASLGGDVLTPGQSVTKTYNYLPDADLATLLSYARAGQINFPGSTVPNIPKGLRSGDRVYCLNGEEPLNAVQGDEVFSIYDDTGRVFNGNAWVSSGYDSWKPYTTLDGAQSRGFHRVIEMLNGELLIVGGYANYVTGGLTATIPAGKTNAGQLGSLCHRFDPKSGILRAACPMPSNNVGVSLGVRGAAVAALLPNGLVLVGGGSNFEIGPNFLENPASCFSDFWTYDPDTDDWTQVASSPETMSPSTQYLTLDNGLVFVAGPQSPGAHTWPSGGGATTLEKARFNFNTHTFSYDYLTDSWTQYGNMNRRRCFAFIMKLDGGKVLVWGGRRDFQPAGIWWKDGEIWDPATGNWTLTAEAPNIPGEDKLSPATYGPSAITSLTDGVDLFGNKFAPVMNLRINGFVPTRDLVGGTVTIANATNPLNNITATIFNVLYDVAGNFTRVYYYNDAAVSNNLTQASPGSTTYTLVEASGIRHDPGIARLPGNKILIAGGFIPASATGRTLAVSLNAGVYTDLVPNSEAARKSALIFDPVANTYERTGDMITAAKGSIPVPLSNGMILFTIGVSFNLCSLAQTQLYNPLLRTWADGAVNDPILDGDGHPIMFQGYAGNPGSGVSPAPGFIEGRVNSPRIVELRDGTAMVFMGLATFTPNPITTSKRAVIYSPGLPSKGSYTRHIP